MRVLVTGGNGFVGSHVVDHLLGEGLTVRCLVRENSNRQWLEGKGLELVECESINDRSVIEDAVRDVNIVIHAAGTLVAPDLDSYRRVNVDPTRLLLEACDRLTCLDRFVFVGSLGAAGPTPDGREALTEDDECQPVSDYGRSKLEAEQLTRSYGNKLPCTILKLCGIYGPRDANGFRVFEIAARKGAIFQLGQVPKLLSMGHVRDIAEGVVRAAMSPASRDQTYFLASEDIYSLQDVRAALQKAIGKPIRLKVIPGFVVQGMMLWSDVLGWVFNKHTLLNRDRLRTLTYPRWTCDIAKAKKDLGFRQTISLEEGFCETFEWYRRQAWI